MPGKAAALNSLELRKQLLLAESELNRAQLVKEWHSMAGEVRALADEARTVRAMATAATTLVMGLASCVSPPAPPTAKPSWWQTILKGAGVASTLWQAFARSNAAGKK